jgi:hypothetical protein
MEFLNSMPGLATLLYLLAGYFICRWIERRADITLDFLAFVFGLFLWLPMIIFIRVRPPQE